MNTETNMKRNPSDGVALASIVAKETTEGKWSGSGGGLGLGTGGFGGFIGGMSGAKHDQSLRAKEFEPPEKDQYRLMNVIGPMASLVGFALLLALSGYMLNMLDTGSEATGSLSRAKEVAQPIMQALMYFLPVVLIIGAGLWFVFFSDDLRDREQERYEAAKHRDEIIESIYYRLRYVEADHVVFDPVSGMEAPATRENIMTMLRTLSASMISKIQLSKERK